VPVPALVLLCAVLACAGPDPVPIPRIPELPAPPPIPEAALTPLPAPLRVRATALHAVVGIGVTFDLPEVDAVVRIAIPGAAPPGEPGILVHTLRLVRPDVTFPVDTIVTGLNFFIEILEPRLVIEELVVEDGAVGTLAAPSQYGGRWLWRAVDVDLLARRIALGGDTALEELHVVRATGRGESKGRPFELRGLGLDVERTARRFVAEAEVRLLESRFTAVLTADATNDWAATVGADTFAFADLRAFVPAIREPDGGRGEGVFVLRGERDGLEEVDVRRLALASGESHIIARGVVRVRGPEPAFRGVLIEATPVHAADVERVFGVELPGGGRWVGWIGGDGTSRGGARLRGELAHLRETGELSRFALEGTVRFEPDAVLDLAVDADPLRVRDTAFDATLRVAGPIDTLRIRGNTVVRGIEGVSATLDAQLLDRAGAPPILRGDARVYATETAARRLAGARPSAPALAGDDAVEAGTLRDDGPRDDALAAPLRAEAVGSVVLADTGRVSVQIVADSIPLALVPVPAAVDSVRGFASGAVRVGGTVAAPTVRGGFDVADGGFFVQPLSMPVDSLSGRVRLEGGRLIPSPLVMTAGGGRAVVTGSVRISGGPRRFDLVLRADSVQVKDDGEGDIVASAELELTGPFARPRLTGRIYDLRGWVREDAFRESTVLDPADPPYADLARRVPWPRNSRLLRRAESERRSPAEVSVVVEVDTTITVIDEDSELYGRGRLLVVSDEAGARARGVLRVLGGFYAFFGERFEVVGGSVRFMEDGFRPRISLKAEHLEEWQVGSGEIAAPDAASRFPPLEFFAIGPAERPTEILHRWSLLPETQEQLAALLIYDLPPQPVTGWRRDPVWRPSSPAELTGERTESQAAPIFWSYVADVAYDFVPLDRGWIAVGTIRVGSVYPARIVVGPMLGVGAVVGRELDVFVTQALDGTFVPGVRVRARRFAPWGARLEVFSVPRFYADTPMGEGHPGFFVRRKTGLGLLWEREF